MAAGSGAFRVWILKSKRDGESGDNYQPPRILILNLDMVSTDGREKHKFSFIFSINVPTRAEAPTDCDLRLFSWRDDVVL